MHTTKLRQPYIPDYEKMAHSKNSSYHLDVASNFLLEINSYVHLLLTAESTKNLNLEHAVMVGHLSRLESLNDELRRQSRSKGNYEFQSVVYRQIIEVVSNLFFFTDNLDTNVENYIKSSVSSEKEFLDLLKTDREKHGLNNIEIEKRQREYINKVCRPAGLTEADIISAKEVKAQGFMLPEVKQRLKSLRNIHVSYVDGLYQGYRVGSSMLHSSWQNILLHHLTYDEDENSFRVKNHNTSPIPDTMYAAASVSGHTIKLYVNFMKDDDRTFIDTALALVPLLEDYIHRLNTASAAHSAALKKYGRLFVSEP